MICVSRSTSLMSLPPVSIGSSRSINHRYNNHMSRDRLLSSLWYCYTEASPGKRGIMVRLKVKEVAQAKGISQRKLSKLSGVDIKNIQKIFRNPESIVNTETLDKLAKALGVDVRELLESVPDDTQRN